MLAFSLASVGTLGVASADEQGQSQDEAASSKVIRVGYLIDNQDYQSGTPDTYMSGWGYKYLQDISYHTEGWKYEYVLGTFSELIAKHEAGEIDLMSNISYTPERAENLLYSTNPSGKKRYYVYVKPDRGDLTVGDPEALRGKTIGVNPDVLQTTEGKAWLAERGIDVTYKEYATGGEVFSALSSGEVDAIIMNDTLSSDDAMPMFYVGESDYYFTVPKSHPDIMAELDAAMTQILTSNPRYPDADIVMCDNTTACFDALSSGRAQAAIIPVTALDVVRSQNDLSTYKTAELPGTVRLTVWMRQDAPTLLAIVNKSIANSQDNITAGTYTAQSYGETETTLVRFVRLYQGVFVAGVAVAFLGIVTILVWSLLCARKAQQEAQAASSAKTAFLSRMSHDIRTPLNGIIRVLSVNEAHAEDAEYVSQNRKKARVAADHLFSLINDVLDMSKIEDSKGVPQAHFRAVHASEQRCAQQLPGHRHGNAHCEGLRGEDGRLYRRHEHSRRGVVVLRRASVRNRSRARATCGFCRRRGRMRCFGNEGAARGRQRPQPRDRDDAACR